MQCETLDAHTSSADRQKSPGDFVAWAVRLRGVDEALLVSRRQLAAVRAAIAG